MSPGQLESLGKGPWRPLIGIMHQMTTNMHFTRNESLTIIRHCHPRRSCANPAPSATCPRHFSLHGQHPLRSSGLRVPGEDTHNCGSHGCRWRKRRDGSNHRPRSGHDPEAQRDRRQQSGCRRRIGCRVCRQGRARRPHFDAGLHRNARDEPGSSKIALRPRQGFRTGRIGGLLTRVDGDEPSRQGQQRQGIDRTAQGVTRQVQLRLGGKWHRAALRSRALSFVHRCQLPPRAVQGLVACSY